MNQNNYDCIINLNFSYLSALFNSILNSEIKFGATLIDSDKIFISNKYLKTLFIDIEECKGKDHILNYFFKALNIFPENFIKYPDNSNNLSKIIIHPGASQNKKIWGINNYINLVKILQKYKKDIEFIITGSKNEIKENLYLENEIKKIGLKVNNLSGKLDLKNLLKEIEKSDLIISSDTLIQHLGALTNKRSITIFLGGAYHYHTYPYQLNKWVIYPEIKCYPCSFQKECKNNFICKRAVTPEMVFNLILDKKTKNSHKTILKDNLIKLL